LVVFANSSTAQTARATRASRATSFATSVVSQPLPLLLILSGPACTDTVYQLKNTLISRMNAPPAEIQTDRGTAAKSKLAAGDDDCGAVAVDSAAGGGGGGAGSGVGSGAAMDSVGAGSGPGSGVGSGSGEGSGPASSPAVGSLPSVLMEPPFRRTIPRQRSL
jgi:hypothetical protein